MNEYEWQSAFNKYTILIRMHCIWFWFPYFSLFQIRAHFVAFIFKYTSRKPELMEFTFLYRLNRRLNWLNLTHKYFFQEIVIGIPCWYGSNRLFCETFCINSLRSCLYVILKSRLNFQPNSGIY